MTIDISSLEAVFLVIGEAGIDSGEWHVCWTRTVAEANELIARLNAEVATLTPEERDTHMDSYANSARPDLAQIVESRRRKLTLDKRYSGDLDGATYRYEMVERWPSLGERVDRRSATGEDYVP